MRKPIAIVALLFAGSTLSAQSATTRPTESAGAVLDKMLPKSATPKPLAPAASTSGGPTTQPGIAPGSPAATLLREGTLLVDRTGRIVRTPDGSQVEFVFDADGIALKDPPVIILPNLKLFSMEQAAAGINRDLRFRITGMVTEYRSRNYVLLDKVVVVPDNKERF